MEGVAVLLAGSRGIEKLPLGTVSSANTKTRSNKARCNGMPMRRPGIPATDAGEPCNFANVFGAATAESLRELSHPYPLEWEIDQNLDNDLASWRLA
jgi:hypothetical protein